MLSSGTTEQGLNSSSATCQPVDAEQLTPLPQTSFPIPNMKTTASPPSLELWKALSPGPAHMKCSVILTDETQSTNPFKIGICTYTLRSPEIRKIKVLRPESRSRLLVRNEQVQRKKVDTGSKSIKSQLVISFQRVQYEKGERVTLQWRILTNTTSASESK